MQDNATRIFYSLPQSIFLPVENLGNHERKFLVNFKIWANYARLIEHGIK